MNSKFVSVFAITLVSSIALPFAHADTLWRQYGFNPAHTSFNDNETILTRANVSQLTSLWSRKISQAVGSAPILGFSNIFVASDGHVIALKAQSGAKLWGHLSCSGDQTVQPALGQGVLLVGDGGGDLAAYHPSTGAQIWCDDESGSIVSAPAIADDTVYITNGADAVALDQLTGQQRWRFTSAVTLTKTPAIANGVVYVTGGNTVFALDQATGKKLWRHNLMQFGVSAPAVSNGMVYVGDGTLYALSAVDGHVIWKNTTVSADGNMPTIAEGRVFVNSEDPSFGLWAFDASDGSFLWMTQKPGESLSTVTVANGVVYDIAEFGELMMFNTENGSFLGSVAHPGGSPFSTAIDSQPVVANGTVYVSRNFFSSNRVDAFHLP